jgi:hypothetical protein
VLAYIDAMPDSATGFRPTPGVRTFAQQFDRIVTASAVYLHDKAALRQYAESTYDYLLDALRHASPAQLRRPVAMYGQPPLPASSQAIEAERSEEAPPMIRKLASGEYRLYSRKKDPKTGKRRNLGTFKTRAAAEKHERAVQYFKRRG